MTFRAFASAVDRLSALRSSPKIVRPLRLLTLISQMLLGGLLIWWLTSTFKTDLDDLVQRARGGDHVALGLSVICFLLTILCIAMRYRLFLPANVSLTYMVGVALLQQAFLNFVPLRLGEVSYPVVLRRDRNISLASSAVMLLTVRLVDLGLVLCVAMAASFRFGIDVRLVALTLAGGLAVAFAGLIVFWRAWPRQLAALVQSLATFLRPLQEPRRLATFATLTVANFVLAVTQTSLALQALGLPLPPLDVAAFNAISLLFALLPIHPPGGWGTADALQIFLLERLGYSAAAATPIILTAHSLFTILFALGGLTGWFIRGRALASTGSELARSAK